MKKKIILKISWIFIICLGILASCIRMESNAMCVSAEDVTESSTEPSASGEWEDFLLAISSTITTLAEAPTPEKGVLLGIQYAIANTEPIRTAGDVTVFNDCSVYTFDYTFQFEDDTSVYGSGFVGSQEVYTSDGVATVSVHQYPNGSAAHAIFSEDSLFYSRITSVSVELIGKPSYTVSYTEPLESVSSTNPSYPFKLHYNDVTLKQQYFQSNSVLGHFTSAVIGDNIANSPSSSMANPERIFVLPPANESQDLNSYLETVYTKYETTYGEPFEYDFPELVPDGVRMPDGSISGESGSSDINVNVDVEFPTHLVPDVPEPDTYDYSQIQQVEIPLADEGVIKTTWISGFSTLIDSMVYTMDAFQLREVVLLLCVVGIFVYLIVRW